MHGQPHNQRDKEQSHTERGRGAWLEKRVKTSLKSL